MFKKKNDSKPSSSKPKARAARAPRASRKVGEANGTRPAVVNAAEVHPSKAKHTNPVAEAAGAESLDPYAAGQHIANPEPSNSAPKAGK